MLSHDSPVGITAGRSEFVSEIFLVSLLMRLYLKIVVILIVAWTK